MQDQSTTPEQVQTAPEPSAEREQLLDQIAEARVNGSDPEQLAKLETALVNSRTPTAQPEPETDPVAEFADPEEDTEETTPEETAGDKPQEQKGESERYRFKDPLDKAIANLAKARGISLAEASAIVSPPMIPDAETYTEAPLENIPVNVKTIQVEIEAAKSRLAEIKEERKNLAGNADLYGMDIAQLDNEQSDILTQLSEARSNLVEAKSDARYAEIDHQRSQNERQSVLAAVASEYPDAVKTGTTLFRMTAGIAAEIRSNPSHPDYQLVDTPAFVRHCTETAAKELKLTPLAKAQSVSKSATPQAKSPGPVSGSRSSAPATPSPTGQSRLAELEAQIQSGIINPSSTTTRSLRGVFIG